MDILWPSHFIHVQAEYLKEDGCKIKPGKFLPVQTIAWPAADASTEGQTVRAGKPNSSSRLQRIITKNSQSRNENFV